MPLRCLRFGLCWNVAAICLPIGSPLDCEDWKKGCNSLSYVLFIYVGQGGGCVA